MIRGFYTAASGIISQEKKLNTYANNIANASTAGYKKDDLVAGTFGEHIAIRMNAYKRQGVHHELGGGVFMQVIDEKYTDYTQGAFQETQRPFDFALQGDGYFVVEDGEGNQLLTRDGQFGLDEDGNLILPGFGRVQGEGGDITLDSSDFYVSPDGTIYMYPEDQGDEGEEVDRLMVVIPTDYATMEKTPAGLFTTDSTAEVDMETGATVVRQGVIERSNVDMSQEMTRIIASQRGLQSAGQLVRMYDEMNAKANDQLGRLR